jgi:hypothetical protein
LNNKEIKDERVEEVIITLELANKDPMNVMEMFVKSQENGNYVLELTW